MRGRRLRRSLAVVVALAAAGGLAGPVRAPAAASLYLRAASNLASVPTAASAPAELQARRASICPAGRAAPAPRRLRLPQALERAQRLLTRARSATASRRVLADRRLRPRGAGQRIAVSGLAAHRPGLALAGLLAAHRAEQRNHATLVSLAVVVSRLGDQAAALGLIDAADRLPRPRTSPMGIDPLALALNARGVAQFRLRRYPAAVAALRRATRREPLLAEARRNLAAAYLCQGRVGDAVGPYLAGARRDPAVRSIAATAVGPVPASAVDLSQGVRGTLPKLTIPQSPEAGAASVDLLKGAEARARAADKEAFAAETALNAAVLARLGSGRYALTYYQGILAMYTTWQTGRPDLGAGYTRVLANQGELDLQYQAFWIGRMPGILETCVSLPTSQQTAQCLQTTCASEVRAAHSAWLPVAERADKELREWAAEQHRYATALAANLRDPDAGRVVVELARSQIMGAYATYLVQRVAAWAGAEKDASGSGCGPGNGAALGEDGQPAMPGVAGCSEAVRAIKFSISLGVFGLSVNCEELEIDVTPPTSGPIRPTVGVGYKFTQGSTTVFVGAKAGAPLDPAFRGSVKAGVYVTFDAAGNTTDLGLRASAGAGAGGGPIAVGSSTLGLKAQLSLADYVL